MLSHFHKFKQNGFTLVELLVGTAVLTIFLFGLFSLLTTFQHQIFETKATLQFEDSVQNFNMNLRKTLRNAVYTMGTNGAVAVLPNLPLRIPGVIKVNFNSAVDCPPGTFASNPACTIGIFFREAAKIGSSATVRQSEILGSGLFYIPRVERQPGFLVLDLGNSVGGVISPDSKDLFFGNIVSIQLMNPMPAPPSTEILRSVDISVTFRKFVSSTPDRWTYCLQAQVVSPYSVANPCSTDGAYRDRVEVFTILFKNNFHPDLPTVGAYGRVHFFQ
jgi:prepilin-type N-terminal cleavage/methylation domain-containing protein